MSFFPLINTSCANGFTTVHNFSPNNWEKVNNNSKTVWAIFSSDNKWKTKKLDTLRYGTSKTYYYNDLLKKLDCKSQPIILLQFRNSPLADTLDYLPNHEFNYTKRPDWRSTVGFDISGSQTSYQGEIYPFPPKASLLTFHPFIQFEKTDNYFLFINVENSPVIRKSTIEIYNANSKSFIDKVEIINNNSNLIELNKYGFSPTDLPVFISRSMAGIPFGLGISVDKKMLSLEHTHPPASFAVHGQRFMVQSEIKKQWFNWLN